MKVYTDFKLRGFKFYKEMTQEEVLAYARSYGFMYKGKDKKGVRYYGNYKYNYIAVME